MLMMARLRLTTRFRTIRIIIIRIPIIRITALVSLLSEDRTFGSLPAFRSIARMGALWAVTPLVVGIHPAVAKPK